jgi:hypothetical protein
MKTGHTLPSMGKLLLNEFASSFSQPTLQRNSLD